MSEIIDCSRGVGSDLDYIFARKKPPWYTDREWNDKLNQLDNSEIDESYLKMFENILTKNV